MNERVFTCVDWCEHLSKEMKIPSLWHLIVESVKEGSKNHSCTCHLPAFYKLKCAKNKGGSNRVISNLSLTFAQMCCFICVFFPSCVCVCRLHLFSLSSWMLPRVSPLIHSTPHTHRNTHDVIIHVQDRFKSKIRNSIKTNDIKVKSDKKMFLLPIHAGYSRNETFKLFFAHVAN